MMMDTERMDVVTIMTDCETWMVRVMFSFKNDRDEIVLTPLECLKLARGLIQAGEDALQAPPNSIRKGNRP